MPYDCITVSVLVNDYPPPELHSTARDQTTHLCEERNLLRIGERVCGRGVCGDDDDDAGLKFGAVFQRGGVAMAADGGRWVFSLRGRD